MTMLNRWKENSAHNEFKGIKYKRTTNNKIESSSKCRFYKWFLTYVPMAEYLVRTFCH